MNVVVLVGNMTRDPEVRYTTGESSSAVARFSIAVNDGYGEHKKTSYPSIVCFGKLAENCEKYTHKGTKVAVLGRIQTGSYTNKDGVKVYTTDVIANQVEFLTQKPKEERSDDGWNDGWGDEQNEFPY